MPRILLIQPSVRSPDGTLVKQKKLYLPGLVLPLIKALTPSNWEVITKIEVVEDINFDEDVDLVGIGTMGYSIYRGVEIAAEFRARGKKVFMAGYMASMAVSETLEHVDSVIVGDGERSYLKLLADFEKTGDIQKIYDDQLDSLDDLPLPDYEVLTSKSIGNMLPVQAGRGCPHTCSFCSIACIYKGRYLVRPIPDVIRDIKRVKELGFKRFYLLDDNIVSKPDYLEALCKEIQPLKMTWASQCSLNLARNPKLLKAVADSGCNLLSFGLESISQDGLIKLGKGWVKVEDHETLLKRITQAGIMPSSEMMVGTDFDNLETIKQTLAFVNRAKIPIPRFYILTPTPGTPLAATLEAEGRLLTKDYTRYNGSEAVFQPALLTAEELTEAYWDLNQRIFGLRSIFRRTLLRRQAFKQPSLHLFAFVVNLHYKRYVNKRVPPNIF